MASDRTPSAAHDVLAQMRQQSLRAQGVVPPEQQVPQSITYTTEEYRKYTNALVKAGIHLLPCKDEHGFEKMAKMLHDTFVAFDDNPPYLGPNGDPVWPARPVAVRVQPPTPNFQTQPPNPGLQAQSAQIAGPVGGTPTVGSGSRPWDTLGKRKISGAPDDEPLAQRARATDDNVTITGLGNTAAFDSQKFSALYQQPNFRR